MNSSSSSHRKNVESVSKILEIGWEQIFNSMSDYVSVHDQNFRIVKVNKSLANLLGVEPEEIVDKYCYEVFHNKSEPWSNCPHLKTLESMSCVSEEVDDPNIGIPLLITTSPIFDEGGNLIGAVHISKNITERKEAEGKIKESEENLSKAQEMAQMGHWRLDVKTMEVEGSDELFKIFDLNKESDSNLDAFAGAVHPDDLEYDMKHIQRGLEEGKPWDIEHRILLKDGTLKWVHAVGEPKVDKEGKTEYILGTVHDITERKEEERTLQDAFEFSEKILSTSSLGIVTYRSDGQCISANDAIGDIIGATKEQVLSQNFRRIESWKKSGLLSDAEEVMSKGIDKSRDVQLTTTFGKEVWLECRFRRFTSRGEHHLLVAFNDITKRKKMENVLRESEEKFRDLAELLPEIVCLTDEKGILTYVNQAGLESFGYTENDFKSGFNILQALVPEDHKRALKGMSNLNAKTSGQGVEYTALRKDGSTFPVIIYSNAIIRDGKPVGMRAIVIDITEQKAADNRIRSTHDELEQRVNERTALLKTEIAERKLVERELFFINEINEIMLAGATESEIFQAITGGIRAYFEYDIADVFTVTKGGKSLIWATISVNEKIRKGLEKLTGMKGENLEIPIMSGSSFHEVITKKKPVILHDMTKMFEEFTPKKSFKKIAPAAAKLSGFDSVIRVPLITEGEVIGIIGIADKRPLMERDVEIIERLSHQLAVLISKVRTREALKSSEERLKILFESAPDAVYLNDLKGNFTGGNLAAEELTGYKKEELIGRNFLKLKLLSKNQIPKATALLAQNALGKPTGPDEFTIHRKDGTKIAAEIRTFPVKIEDQTQILGVARDITSRKMAEDSLRESEERYRGIFENVNDVIVYVDKRGTILNINEKVGDIVGYKREEIIGENILKFGIIGPKNLPKISKMFFESVRRGDVFRAADAPINLMELELKHKDGSTVPVETSTSIIKKNGKTEGFSTIIRDITERRKSQEELQKSEEKYSTLVEKGNDGIIIIQDGLLAFVNSRILEMTDLTEADAVGKPFMGFISPEFREAVVDRYKKRMAGEKVESRYETEILSKEGRSIPVEINASVIDYEGKPADMAMIRDITDRKEAEKVIHESKERFRAIATTTPTAMLVSRISDGTIVFGNEALADLFGLSLEEVIGKKTPDFYYNTKDRGKIIKILKKEGTINNYEVQVKKSDGTPFWVVCSLRIITFENEPAILTGFMDVTERKRAAEKLQKRTHDLGERVKEINCLYEISKLTTDPDVTLIEIFQGAVTLIPRSWQYPEITYTKITYGDQVFKTDNYGKHREKQITSIMAHGEEVGKLEVGYTKKKPDIYEGPFLKEERALIEAIGKHLGNKIERRDAEEELQKAYEELKTLDELKTNVISNVSHELRTPITIAKGALELLVNEESPDQKNLLISTGIKALARQNVVVENLITAAKNDALKEKISKGSTDMEILSNKLILEFNPLLNKEEIKVNIHVEKDLPRAHANTNHIELVLRNLIGNAIKFNKKGGSITIKVSKKKDFIETCVTDTGIGIAEGNLDKIFDRLYQVDSSTERDYGGTGLGLAIVKEAIKAHRGEIKVKSTKGKGSSFCFTLPIYKKE